MVQSEFKLVVAGGDMDDVNHEIKVRISLWGSITDILYKEFNDVAEIV